MKIALVIAKTHTHIRTSASTLMRLTARTTSITGTLSGFALYATLVFSLTRDHNLSTLITGQ